jgi:hypothetical protein
MTTRRLLALAASVPVAALVATTMTASPAAARPADGRGGDRCVQSAPIPASAVTAASHLGCSLVGRVVTDGRVSVMVPPPGMSVGGEGVGRHGDVRGLRVTNTGTTVRVVHEGHGSRGVGGGGWYLAPLNTTSTTSTAPTTMTTTTTTPTVMMTQRAGDPAACKDRTFNLEHHHWTRSLRYHVNLGRMPGRFHKKTVARQIKVANANMRKGRTSCGKPRITAPASHFLGRTSKKPNIDPNAPNGPKCGNPNQLNIVGFGNLPGGLLGWTCYWFIGGRIVGTDMMIDNGPNLSTKLPDNCSNMWDFEGTVTHEWGHSYGLAHTGSGHSNLTMQHLLTPCSTYARTLGLGDWLGMKKMYGAR